MQPVRKLNLFHTLVPFCMNGFLYLLLQIKSKSSESKTKKLSYVSSTSNIPLISDTIGNLYDNKTHLKDFSLLIFLSGQRLDHAAETYPNRDAYVFPQTNQRLTFEALKIQVIT
jgi:hypothetical protein